eukprot:m.242677 g.242677  ORF g.242677 m.242677 type:complete len:607 (-) comp33802_c1_seq3:123-1943(-)
MAHISPAYGLAKDVDGGRPHTRIGVLGGGQLGRMMAEAAHRLGLQLVALDPKGDTSPTGQVTKCLAGSFQDEAKIRELAAVTDVLTVEIEHVNAEILTTMASEGVAIHPSGKTIHMIKDKFRQKEFLSQLGIAIGEYQVVATVADAESAGDSFGYPYMLKSRLLAYDGKGNAVVKSRDDLPSALKQLRPTYADDTTDLMLYAEKWVPFTKELAIMVVRGSEGVDAYPVVETRQLNSVCDTVVAPAQIPACVAADVRALALETVKHLDGRGIYGIEFFVTSDNRVLLNEIAPRPHNSGHYTMEACETDQFENHLRAVAGLPLGSCELQVGVAAMYNILGHATGDATQTYAPLMAALRVPGARVHSYGKQSLTVGQLENVAPGRKLAHVTVVAPTIAHLRTRLAAISPDLLDRCGFPSSSSTSSSATSSSSSSTLPVVGIVMGSDSDLPCMQDAAHALDNLGIAYELTIVSAHRTPDRLMTYGRTASARGLRVIIAGAGGAAHLPGMLAAVTALPVIGVPIKTSTLNGQDSLLSIVQMPRGVPVATVAIGNATNAGLLAARILGAGDGAIERRMDAFLTTQEQQVQDKIEKMATLGWKDYLAQMPHNN